MGKKVLRGFLIMVVMLAVFSSFVYADIIHLKSGGKIEGKIIERPEYPPKTLPLTYKIETSYGIVTVKESKVESINYGDVNFQLPQTVRTPSIEEETNYIISLAKLQKRNRRIFEEVSSVLKEMLVTKSFTSKGTRFRTYDALKKKVNIYLREIRKIHPPQKYRKSYRYFTESVEAMRDSLHWAQYDQWDKVNLALDQTERKRKAYLEELERLDTGR